MMKKNLTCSFLGLGLIGGSLAKAIRQFLPDTLIKACDTDEAALQAAVRDGVVEEAFSSPDTSFCDCDYLFLCAPVSVNLESLKTLIPLLSPKTILTDVGSVKGPIQKRIEQLGLENRFIGGHPMTGSERYGYTNSNASLLENAYYILTPSPAVKEEDAKALSLLIQTIGAIPYILDASSHDLTTAAISHLPHLVASALVNLVKEGDDEQETFKTLAAGGFKDITRIASASSALWQQITLENRENILVFLDRYIHQLTLLKKDLEATDTDRMYTFFETARLYRDSFADSRSGPLMKQYLIHLDIPDKTGAIAAIAGLLASHSISIKNMGITHNREYQEGSLRMELYTQAEHEKAISVLTGSGYRLHL